MPITFVPDHAAVAVPAIERAAARWHDELGGAWLGPRFDLGQAGFATRQLHYPGGPSSSCSSRSTPKASRPASSNVAAPACTT